MNNQTSNLNDANLEAVTVDLTLAACSAFRPQPSLPTRASPKSFFNSATNYWSRTARSWPSLTR